MSYKVVLKDELTAQETVLGTYDDAFDAELDKSLYDIEYANDQGITIEIVEED